MGVNPRTTLRAVLFACFAGYLIASALPCSAAPLPGLKVSDNKRFLVTDTGQPFFYMADTAWELFHRLDRDGASKYLQNRADLGFTAIQAVALAELNGLNDPNAYGDRALIGNDPTKPDVTEGADPADPKQYDYWDHVDFIVDAAAARGLYVAMLPTWGSHVVDKTINPSNAQAYGEFLGKRYKGKPIIWVLGGDRPADQHLETWRNLAKGIAIGVSGREDYDAVLMTYHPPGGNGSSTWFHDDNWLDFNMRQNGHVAEYTNRYSNTSKDYARTPVKPVVDGEPIYEDHPVSFKANEFGHSIAADVRRAFYWDVFSGACGHTYGHHSVWQMWEPKRQPINNPLMPWSDAINQPGAAQMRYGRRLIESRPFLSRVPDDSLIVTDRVPTSVPGTGRYRFVATRNDDGAYAFVYAPCGRPFSVDLSKLSGTELRAWWFNPRNGEAKDAGTFNREGQRQFTSPDPGEHLDWVLVLDDVSKDFPAPGATTAKTASPATR